MNCMLLMTVGWEVVHSNLWKVLSRRFGLITISKTSLCLRAWAYEPYPLRHASVGIARNFLLLKNMYFHFWDNGTNVIVSMNCSLLMRVGFEPMKLSITNSTKNFCIHAATLKFYDSTYGSPNNAQLIQQKNKDRIQKFSRVLIFAHHFIFKVW